MPGISVCALDSEKRLKYNRFGGDRMGMTDKQFNGFLRFLLDTLEDAQKEQTMEAKTEKLQRIIEHIRDTIED